MAATKARVFRLNKDSKSSIHLEDNAVSIVGTDKNFVVCNEMGTAIKGPVSLISGSQQRRTGALFVGLNDFFEMIPQSIFTPIPSKVPMPPVFAIQNIAKDLAFFLALLA